MRASSCFDEHIREKAVTRLDVERAPAHRVEDGGSCCTTNPSCSLDDRAGRGFEALLRWHHPTRGLLYPDDFL